MATALIPETGAGVTGADTYITTANISAWLALYYAAATFSEWTAAADATKDAWARYARLYLDNKYRHKWRGTKYDEDYALPWPRTAFYNSNGHEVDSTDTGDGMPAGLTAAQAYLAWRASKGDTFFPVNENAAAKSKSWSNQSESGSEVFVGGGASKDLKAYPMVDHLLSDLIQSGFAVERC